MNKLIYNGYLYGNKWLTKAAYSHKYFNVFMYFFTKYIRIISFIILAIIFLISIINISFNKGKKQLFSLFLKEKYKKEKLKIANDTLVLYKKYVDSLYKDKEFKRFVIYKHSNITAPSNIEDYEKIRKKYKIPISIFYRWIHTESKFKNSAVSQKGARGVTQIMPSTREYIERNIGPSTNLEAGAWYLVSLKGTWEEKLCQYNSGKKTAECKETKNYVKTILRK